MHTFTFYKLVDSLVAFELAAELNGFAVHVLNLLLLANDMRQLASVAIAVFVPFPMNMDRVG